MTYTMNVFVLLHVAFVFAVFLTIYIAKVENKNQIHYSYLVSSVLMGIWSLGGILDNYYTFFTGHFNIKFFWLGSIGLFFCPVMLLITSRIFLLGKIKFNYKYKLLFLIPTISYIILITNQYHNLYYENFSIYNYETIYGKYFNIHAIYSYICVVVALFNFLASTIRNSGVFSKQSMLVFISSAVPLIVNVLFTYKVIHLTMYITCVAFSFTIICVYFAIQKYGFMDITPLSMQKVIDSISDAFVIIDRNYKVINFNQTFVTLIDGIDNINLKDNFLDKLSTYEEFDIDLLKNYISRNLKNLENIKLSKYFTFLDKYFDIELIPILSNDNCYMATLILIKDVTQLKHSQNIMVEQERLSSLGQLIGGIAHNLKTPIMSIAGVTEGLTDLIKEYDESIDDPSVTKEDHHEIAKDMQDWVDKVKPYLSYMTEVINTVKGQAVSMNASTMTNFSAKELISRVNILLRNELKRRHCVLNLDVDVNENTSIAGEISAIVQVLDNLVINAMDAYKENGGDINIKVREDENKVYIEVKDYGCGIPQKVQEKLFKEMVTSKGKNGTGLGLYMSFSTIKGKFKGDIKFETEEGRGTTFFIELPKF